MTSATDSATSGFFGHGDMQKEFEEASFSLKPGEISPVVETASGLHLIERYVICHYYMDIAHLHLATLCGRAHSALVAQSFRFRLHYGWRTASRGTTFADMSLFRLE